MLLQPFKDPRRIKSVVHVEKVDGKYKPTKPLKVYEIKSLTCYGADLRDNFYTLLCCFDDDDDVERKISMTLAGFEYESLGNPGGNVLMTGHMLCESTVAEITEVYGVKPEPDPEPEPVCEEGEWKWVGADEEKAKAKLLKAIQKGRKIRIDRDYLDVAGLDNPSCWVTAMKARIGDVVQLTEANFTECSVRCDGYLYEFQDFAVFKKKKKKKAGGWKDEAGLKVGQRVRFKAVEFLQGNKCGAVLDVAGNTGVITELNAYEKDEGFYHGIRIDCKNKTLYFHERMFERI